MLNFSILGLLQRLHRLNIQAVLQADAEESGIKFPCAEKHLEKSGTKSYATPTVTDISNQLIQKSVKNALSRAKETLASLEMDKLLKIHSKWDDVKWSKLDDCDVQPNLGNDDDEEDDDEEDNDQEKNTESATKEKEVVSAIIQEVCKEDPVEVEKDLKSISQEVKGAVSDIIDSKVSKRIETLRKSLPPVKLNSGMPCYAFTNISTIAEENSKKTFSPYVDVTHNDRTFSIRKTTAVWLLQESERVSTDRLFRVREKQPFESTLQALTTVSSPNPVISATIAVGNLCVFKFIPDWKLGRVLQFAKYDSDAKKYHKSYKDNSVKTDIKNVGVLCTWYECVKDNLFQLARNSENDYTPIEEYVCVVPEDCVSVSVTEEDVSNSSVLPAKSQSSITAKSFLIKEQCMASLISMIESHKPTNRNPTLIKSNKRGQSTLASEILIPDDYKTDIVQDVKDHWTKCGGISLTKRDLHKLTSGKELSDLHINAFQNLLKEQFNVFGGLQSTLLQQKQSPLTNKKERNIQAINISISPTVKHWAVLEIHSNSVFCMIQLTLQLQEMASKS